MSCIQCELLVGERAVWFAVFFFCLFYNLKLLKQAELQEFGSSLVFYQSPPAFAHSIKRTQFLETSCYSASQLNPDIR